MRDSHFHPPSEKKNLRRLKTSRHFSSVHKSDAGQSWPHPPVIGPMHWQEIADPLAKGAAIAFNAKKKAGPNQRVRLFLDARK
jgi:hypothetical protein